MPTSRARKPASNGSADVHPAARPVRPATRLGAAATDHGLGPAATGPEAAVPTSAPDPPTTEEPTTPTPEVSVGEVGDTLSVENADGPLGDITVTKVRSAARDPDPYIGDGPSAAGS